MNKSNWLSIGKTFISEKQLQQQREEDQKEKKVKLEGD